METFRLVRCHDPAAWDRFVRESPQGTAMCFSAVLGALGVEYELWFVEERGYDIPQLAFPLLFAGGVPLRAPVPYMAFHGPMFGPLVSKEPIHRRTPHQLQLVEFIIGELSRRLPRISFSLHTSFNDLRSFQWFNYHEPAGGTFRIDLRYTGILDLQQYDSRDAMLAAMRSVRRQEVKRAENGGCTMEESADLDILVALHTTTFERQGLTRSEEEVTVIKSLTAAALREKFGHLWIARTAAGEPASALVFIHDERTAHYLIGSNDPIFRNSGASTWLMVQVLEHYRRTGTKAADFVGLNSPNRGDFKTSFGCHPVPYFNVDWVAPIAAA